jgi:DeoR/GlpR family transcriptional regulator of sugar metabolism
MSSLRCGPPVNYRVSTMTIHRDLDWLERRGPVRGFRGSVIARLSGAFESQLAHMAFIAPVGRRRLIAKAAAS